MQVGVKLLSERVPVGEIVFARSFFALVPVFGMLIFQGQLIQALRTSSVALHAGRGVIGISAMGLGFMALSYLPLPETMMIGYAAPLMIVALSAIILREPVRIYRWSATVAGFLGILVILWPRLSLIAGGAELGSGQLLGALLALAGAFCAAFAGIFVRSMTRTESTGTIVVYFSLTGSVLALLTLPLGWVMPTPAEAALLLGIGLFGGVGQILMTSAFRHAAAATVASFEYVSMLWGISFGFLVFGEVPTASVVLGGGIVIAASIFIIFRERQLGIQRARERKAARPTPL
jgi:drug/metabolite transporter (DMT)-like permease